jgi:hypothetical protein
MNYEEAIAYFICWEKTNGPPSAVAVDNKKLITYSVGVGKSNKSSNM